MIKIIEPIEHDYISDFWESLIQEAKIDASNSKYLNKLIERIFVQNTEKEGVLSSIITGALDDIAQLDTSLNELCLDVLNENSDIIHAVTNDINAVYERDPACEKRYHVLLFYKGFQALLVHRIAHHLWNNNQHNIAHYLNYLSSCKFAVDIHPGAKISEGVFLDHGTGIVIGETAVVGRNVSILQGVTLGGTGKETKDRHPKIAESVLIGAGAILLGNINVSRFSKIGAGTVLLKDIQEHATVVGVPGKVVGLLPENERPGESMKQK
jgi:serine O-acetyltransferase